MDTKNESSSDASKAIEDDAVVSTTEAARQLGVSVRTVQLWVENGRLLAWKTAGNHRRIFQWSIDDYRRDEGQTLSPKIVAERKAQDSSTILLIEDDRTTQVYYETMLHLLDIPDQVETAADGIEGMVALGKYEPWLIILDIDMPRLDGIDVMKTLERQKLVSTVSLIVISNVPHEEAVQRGLPSDCMFFSKPVSLDDFRAAVETQRALAEQRKVHQTDRRVKS